MKKLNWKTITQAALGTIMAVFMIFLFTSSINLKKDTDANTRHRTKEAVELKGDVEELHIKLDTLLLREAEDRAMQKLIWEKVKDD